MISSSEEEEVDESVGFEESLERLRGEVVVVGGTERRLEVEVEVEVEGVCLDA